MKRPVVSALAIILCFQAFAQVAITGEGVPQPGDTIRRSTSPAPEWMGYQQGGENQTWDFANLPVVAQQVDTFVSVTETPALYQLFFNNQFIYPDHKASVARKLSEFTSIPSFEVSDAYQFLKMDDNQLREVGYGISLAGLPLPMQYQQIDTLYRFPIEYGDVDSSQSHFEVSIPDMGFLMIDRSRKNTADGWGNLITPYGIFATLRVKTDIVEYDSLFIDSLNMGMPLTRYITEYKWFSNEFPLPVLQVTEEGFIVTVTYIDSLRSTFLNVPEPEQLKFNFSVYPNPCSDYLSISYELFKEADIRISVHSIYGNELRQFVKARQTKGLYNRVLYLKENGIKPGIYLLRVTIDNVPHIKRIILN